MRLYYCRKPTVPLRPLPFVERVEKHIKETVEIGRGVGKLESLQYEGW